MEAFNLALREAGVRDPQFREVRASQPTPVCEAMRLLAAELLGTGRLRPELTDAGYAPAQYADLVTDVWVNALLIPGTGQR